MEQDPTKQGDRTWSGEPLWRGYPTVSRAVKVVPAGDHFRALGQAGRQTAFEVLLREEQLWRFRREVERAGAVTEGFPPWTEPGPGGQPPERPPRKGPHGPIGTEGDDDIPKPNLFKPSAPKPLLLLADAERGRPVLPSKALSPDAIALINPLEERLPRPEYLGDPGTNPNSLRSQRWGVIAPRGPAGEALLEAIRPLMEWRSKEQGGKEVRVYRVATKGGTAEANEWVRTVYRDDAVPENERPGYVLILGDLWQVSSELQQRLSLSAYVGRLCFDEPAGYRAYADKVLRHENAPPTQDARALFFTTHDGSMATGVGYDSLVTPALEACDAVPRDDYPVREILEVGSPDDWSARRLLEAVRDTSPSVLFTLSHGVAAARGAPYEQRRQQQGAMAFGDQAPLTAQHVAQGPFLPGGAWFFLACLSAGTPSRSVYRPWLEKLKADGEYEGRISSVLAALPAAGEQPFIAALPRAALANPEGPLVILGHLDLAWTYAFLDAYGARQPARFVEVLKQLWTGRRAGVAAKSFLRYASESESELLGLAQADVELQPGQTPPLEVVHRGHLWMARHDLVGYLLLGDPAVRVAPERD